MPAAPSQRALVALGGVLFATTSVLLGGYGTPHAGVGRLYYFAVVLVAFASGPGVGAAAGALAAALFGVAVLVNPNLPLSEIASANNAMRCLSYVGLGLLVGWFAAQNRELTERLRLLAKVDPVTGIANLRSFEEMITRMLDTAVPFTLFIVDCAASADEGDIVDDRMQKAAMQLRRESGLVVDVARIGTTERAVLVSGVVTPATVATRLEQLVASPRTQSAVGWAVHPSDGTNALALHRAAVERLYVRRLFRAQGAPADAAAAGA